VGGGVILYRLAKKTFDVSYTTRKGSSAPHGAHNIHTGFFPILKLDSLAAESEAAQQL